MTNYPVKVADSCPLAIEQARYNKLTGQIIQLTEIEKEQQKQIALKKQIFLEKVSKEIKEREKENINKKKAAAMNPVTNVEEYMKVESEEEDIKIIGGKKKKE